MFRFPFPWFLLGVAIACLTGCGEIDASREAFDRGNYVSAFKYADRAARAGDPAAMNSLGIHYYLGVGVQRDFLEARRWFESAAKRDNTNGQCNLALLYLRGLGGRQDFMMAYVWFEKAHLAGNPRAEPYLATMGDSLTPNQIAKGRQLLLQNRPD